MTDYDAVQQHFISGMTNIYDQITELRDFCALCGWTIHDDQTAGTNKYFIIKSNDAVIDYRERPCYIGFKVFSAYKYYLRAFIFLHWDNTDQTYQGIRRWSSNYSYWTDANITNAYFRLHTLVWNSSGVNNLTLYGNKYYINLLLHRDSDNTHIGFNIFKFMDTVYDYKFKILNDVEKGKLRTLQLEENQAQKLKLGDSLWLLCKDNNTFSKIDIKNIDIVNDTVVSDEVYWPTVSGSLLGSTMQLLPWAIKLDDCFDGGYTDTFYYTTFMCFNNSAVNSDYKSNPSYYTGYLSTSAYAFPASTTASPLYTVGNRQSINDLLYGQPNELFGYNDYMKSGGGSNRDTVGYNLNYVGTATSGTEDMLIDLSKSWDIDELESKCIIITDGMSAGDVLHIISNTSDTVTISGSFTDAPDTSTEYGVYDAGYIKVYNNQRSGSYQYLLRIA